MTIRKTGLFKNCWLCWCGNSSRKKGFYPVNAEGNYQRDLLGRGRYYACSQCGRIIEPETLEIVGVTKHFKLSPREVRNLIIFLQAEGREPVGLGYTILYTFLSPWRRYSSWRLSPRGGA